MENQNQNIQNRLPDAERSKVLNFGDAVVREIQILKIRQQIQVLHASDAVGLQIEGHQLRHHLQILDLADAIAF